MVCLFLFNGIIFAAPSSTYEANRSALAPPLATKPPAEITYTKETGKWDVITNGDPGYSFRNRWAFADISVLIGQMLILAREHKLHNPRDILKGELISLIRKHFRNRKAEAELLREDNVFGRYDIDHIEEVREGGEITGFSLSMRP